MPDSATVDQLNCFDRVTRAQALQRLAADVPPIHGRGEAAVANMHCHTFFSYNGYGDSPSALAWLAHEKEIDLMGIVDFDVLDGVDEFLDACELLGVRGSAGLETRVFLPEFSRREINSPGEPGVLYHMGIGFTTGVVSAEAQSILNDLKAQSAQRNLGLIERINRYLGDVTLDYEQDVLPLTPAGNATERHIVAAYIDKAAATVAEPAAFWAAKLNLPLDEVDTLSTDSPALQGAVRARLMKRGGVGYVQPDHTTFPPVEVVHALIHACDALPCAAWLDGTSTGEQAIEELLDLLIDKGACVLNIIPDRNWNIADAEVKQCKLANLYAVVALAEQHDLPLNIGTEINAYGQKLIDDFDAPELDPVRGAFLDGAYFAYGHTVMQRKKQMGYASEWAQRNLKSRATRNRFFTDMGKLLPTGGVGSKVLADMSSEMSPTDVRAEVISALKLYAQEK